MKSGYVSSVDLLIEVFLYAPKDRHIKMAPSVCLLTLSRPGYNFLMYGQILK